MKNVKKWVMSKEDFANPKIYYDKIATYVSSTYGIDKEVVIQKIHDSMYFGGAVCSSNEKHIGIESGYDRSLISVGEIV
jgi:hypothetical protein